MKKKPTKKEIENYTYTVFFDFESGKNSINILRFITITKLKKYLKQPIKLFKRMMEYELGLGIWNCAENKYRIWITDGMGGDYLVSGKLYKTQNLPDYQDLKIELEVK